MHSIERWYWSYALLGAAGAGLIPILLPLTVARSAGPSGAGLVMAAFSLGGLAAPLWGRMADVHRLHRPLLAGGLLALAASSAVIPLIRGFPALLGLAFVQGCGLAAASTVAILFVVEAHPRREWDGRIGWLQAFYAAGQVAGLLAAGDLGPGLAGPGLWLAAGLSAVAVLPGLLGAPRLRDAPLARRPAVSQPARHAEWPAASPHRLYHHPRSVTGPRLRRTLSTGLVVTLAGWMVSFAGSAAFFSLYPVLMAGEYGAPAGLSSVGFAAAAAAGLFLYAPAGRWSARRGPRRLLVLGMAVRLAAFAGLWALSRAPLALRAWPALAAFLLVVLAWSFLGVGSAALVAGLSSSEGEGMGIFNAITALAGVIGAAVGGWAAAAGGYAAVPVLGIGGSLIGLIVFAAGAPGRKEISG